MLFRSNLVEYAEARERLTPGSTGLLHLADGVVAAFVGPGSPISRVCGLGMSGPVTEGQLEQVEAFFARHGAPVQVETCPLADRSLFELLAQRGYRIGPGFKNTLIRPPVAPALAAGDLSISLAGPDEYDQWAGTLARGFAGTEEIGPADRHIFEPMPRTLSVRPYLARLEGGEVAGAGALMIRDGLGLLSTASTRVAFRGRGIQTALLRTRIEAALAAGCDLLASEARPGIPSQRNMERAGFRVIYTVITMVK